MQNDKDVLGRRWAMAELEEKVGRAGQGPRIVPALVISAEKDPFWRIRRARVVGDRGYLFARSGSGTGPSGRKA